MIIDIFSLYRVQNFPNVKQCWRKERRLKYHQIAFKLLHVPFPIWLHYLIKFASPAAYSVAGIQSNYSNTTQFPELIICCIHTKKTNETDFTEINLCHRRSDNQTIKKNCHMNSGLPLDIKKYYNSFYYKEINYSKLNQIIIKKPFTSN